MTQNTQDYIDRHYTRSTLGNLVVPSHRAPKEVSVEMDAQFGPAQVPNGGEYAYWEIDADDISDDSRPDAAE